jgi:uncharacterized membrane protein
MPGPGVLTEEKEKEQKGITVDRIASFSDAVMAVAITLLILSIDVPVVPKDLADVKLGGELWALWPKFGAFLISFAIIGFFWAFHHRLFTYIKRYTPLLLWVNLFFLMCIVFIPFASDLFSEYSFTAAGTVFYAVSWAIPSLLLSFMWWYAYSGNRLVSSDFNVEGGKHASAAFMFTGCVFLASVPIALINVNAAQYFWLVLPPGHIILGRFFSKRGG